MSSFPSAKQVASAKGYAAFRSGQNCPYDHFTNRELVDAFYQGMARAEREHAAAEVMA